MKVEEKISVFSQVVMDEVEEKRKKLLAEMEREFNKACEEAEADARKKYENQIRQEQYQMEQVHNKEYLNTTMESRKALADLKDKLIDELFHSIEERLRNFVLTEDYGNYLVQKISEVAGKYPGDKLEVLLMNRDLKFSERLGLTTSGTDEDFIGGFKIIFKDRNAVQDNTFLDRLNEERLNFNLLRVV